MIERDLYVEQLAVPVRIDLPQGTNVQQIKFSFRDIKPEGSIRIYIKKPSGAEIYNNASDSSLDAGIPYAVFDTTTQMTAEAGQMQGQVRVTGAGDKVLNSFPITLNIIESPYSENAIESSNEFSSLDEKIELVDAAVGIVQETNSEVSEAEAARASAEITRKSDEDARKSQERTRQQNENARQSWYNNVKQELSNASFDIGTVSTGAVGSDAQASISGSPFNQTLNLVIPRGEKGNPGGIGVEYVPLADIDDVQYDQDTIVVSTDTLGTLVYGVYLYLADAVRANTPF